MQRELHKRRHRGDGQIEQVRSGTCCGAEALNYHCEQEARGPGGEGPPRAPWSAAHETTWPRRGASIGPHCPGQWGSRGGCLVPGTEDVRVRKGGVTQILEVPVKAEAGMTSSDL